VWRILFASVFAWSALTAPASGADVTGAGATFPYPLYATWAAAYKAKTGILVNYQSIGSGGGIKQIQAKTIDFGATDVPLTADELDRAGLLQFPMVMGGIVPVINLRGIPDGALRLDGATLASIFLRETAKWNDRLLVGLNPDLQLPAGAITPIHRADGSGTTFLFTDYLSKVSSGFKDRIGRGAAVEWPAGLGGKGNEGVAALVQRTNGTIGYVEYTYAKQNKMNIVRLKNRAGEFVLPGAAGFRAAAAAADWAAVTNGATLTDAPGDETWPITGVSFILLRKIADHPQAVRGAIGFFAWAYEEGAPIAVSLDYVPVPKSVVKQAKKAWRKIKTPDGQPLWAGPPS